MAGEAPTPAVGASSRETEPALEEPTLEGAFAPDGVDLTAIRWMLQLTPTERLQAAQDLIDTAWALREGDQDSAP